jgi:hypothetical protein
MKVSVCISRSGVETAQLIVEAKSVDAAEKRIEKLLDTTHRVSLERLVRNRGIRLGDTECNGDEESSWELS